MQSITRESALEFSTVIEAVKDRPIVPPAALQPHPRGLNLRPQETFIHAFCLNSLKQGEAVAIGNGQYQNGIVHLAKKPLSLRGRKPVAISQPPGIDCFVVLLLAMTPVSHSDSLVTAQFRIRIARSLRGRLHRLGQIQNVTCNFVILN